MLSFKKFLTEIKLPLVKLNALTSDDILINLDRIKELGLEKQFDINNLARWKGDRLANH